MSHTLINMRKIIPVSYTRLVCVFEKDDFVYSRTRGDHLIYTKPGIPRPLVISKYDAVPVFIIKNLIRATGMSRERYFELLEEC
jgi:predicted RNA binding protein YcfA (HicA-like mRNA interferase family)